MRPGILAPLALAAVMTLTPTPSAHGQATQVGPERGQLVVVGGGDQIDPILHRFVDMAGGPMAPIVVIPTASGAETYDAFHWQARWFREQAGVGDVTVLHTLDREEADSEAFTAPLRQARAVWITGGRQWRLADSYLGTRTQRELEALLARGGVIGGTSAGATILGSFLVRGHSEENLTMAGDHQEGFGFLRGVAIDQHLLARNRQFDLIEVVAERPALLGIGIDENTGIVVRRDGFEVVGESYVAIYDHGRQLPNDGRFLLLRAGDRFALDTRQASRPGYTAEDFERLRQEDWPQR